MTVIYIYIMNGRVHIYIYIEGYRCWFVSFLLLRPPLLYYRTISIHRLSPSMLYDSVCFCPTVCYTIIYK